MQGRRSCVFGDHYRKARAFDDHFQSLIVPHAGVSFDADSDSDISRVSLPPSLFQSHPSLSDQPGLVFTSYSTAVLFPLTQSESINSTRLSVIGSSVLAATVVSGQSNAVRNLAEPVIVEFRVNRSMVGSL